MINTNPLRYSDLITPDSSVTDLISQLTDLLAKYNEIKQSIQTTAAEMQKNMQGVAGATEEQRKEISRTYEESQRLAKAYEEVSNQERLAYRRKQEVIQAVKEEQRIDKLVVELQNSKEGSYNRLSAQYRLNKMRLNEMSDAERKGTEAGRQLEAETKNIYERMKQLQEATGKHTLSVGDYEKALRRLPGITNVLPGQLGGITNAIRTLGENFKTLGSTQAPLAAKAFSGIGIAIAGVAGIAVGLFQTLRSGIRKIAEFEQANANLSTILGASKEEMEGLTKAAQELGRTTEYTASQVTGLQTELAKLGFLKPQILAMEESILHFATAVGATLPEAAQVAGSTLRSFGLRSDETEKALTILAVATNKSSLDFDKIRTSISNVFPVAKSFGLSLEDTVALLAALSDAGYDASSASTALRNILLNMVNTNGKLSKSLGGNVKTLDDILKGFKKLTDQGIDLEKALELTSIRSAGAFTVLLDGSEKTRKLRDELAGVTNELEEISKQRLDTVEGQVKILESAWEGLTLKFSESKGVIKGVLEVLTSAVTGITEFLFPDEVGEKAKEFEERFQRIWDTEGPERAKESINEFVSEAEANMINLDKNLEKKLEGRGFFKRLWDSSNIWDDADKDLSEAENRFSAMMRARETFFARIDAQEKEREKQRQEEQEKAEAEAAKAEEETKKQIAEAKKRRLAEKQAVIESINLEIAVTDEGTEEMKRLRLEKNEAELQLELERFRQNTTRKLEDEEKIRAKYRKQAEKIELKHTQDVEAKRRKEIEDSVKTLQAQLTNQQLDVTNAATDKERLDNQLKVLETQRKIEIEQNKLKAENLRIDEAKINQKYDNLRLKTTNEFYFKQGEEALNLQLDLEQSKFDLTQTSERKRSEFELKQEKKKLQKLLELNLKYNTALTPIQKKQIEEYYKNLIKGIDNALAKGYKYKDFGDLFFDITGLGDLWDEAQKNAFSEVISTMQDSLASLADSWYQLADAAVQAADKQVESAQKALDAEIEARNNGYANNVEQAQKNLMLEKKQQKQALKEREKAQKAQLALDTLTQTSSLVTATANIWSAFSTVPPLALAMIALMWGSFALAKVKAAQVAGVQNKGDEKYAEGTVELLEGGSHASGHDIDLGRKKNGKRRRAEGGEYFAIINKRNSRKYGSIIPDVINSFNNGTFADKYQRASCAMAGCAINMAGGTDVSRLEKDVRAIRQQGDDGRMVESDGTMIIRHKNLTRRIVR